jgi:preprotein translocase subunit SecF
MRRLRLVRDDTRIPFFRYRWIAFAWSAIVLLATVALVGTVGLNLGIDFKGGILLEIRTPGPADLAKMREVLGGVGLGEVALQEAGGPDQVLIRAEVPEGDQAAQREAIERIKGALDAQVGSGIVYQRSEFVGPKVSSELLMNGVYAVLVSLAGVFAYLWFRFEWQYGVGAIAALVHDVSATMAIYAIFQIEFNLTSVAAVLTLVGYSLNDTVVIYDRVRENLRRFKAMPIEQLLDLSINETLARTLMTSLTTLVALVPLWVLGGDVIRDFTVIMIWGVIVGTYSTMYVATPILFYLNIRATKAAAEPAAQAKGGSAGAGPAKKPAAAVPAPSAPALRRG